jgi:hypothetical protein
MINEKYRLTKYNPAFRDEFGNYRRNEWTDVDDVGRNIDGHVLTQDEFDHTINAYHHAFELFAREAGVQQLAVLDLYQGPGLEEPWQKLSEGDVLPLETALQMARHILAGGPLSARLEDTDRFYLHVGEHLYVWLGSEIPCTNAVEGSRRVGLFVEVGIDSPMWPEDVPRHWWLTDGLPVGFRVVSLARDDGRVLERWDVPNDNVSALHALFVQHPGDENFYDVYEIDEAQRPAAESILGRTLGKDADHVMQSYSID